jgi:hypothetical protein
MPSPVGNSTPTNEQVLHTCGLLPKTFLLFCRKHGSMGMQDRLALSETCPECRSILFVVPEGTVFVWDDKEDV